MVVLTSKKLEYVQNISTNDLLPLFNSNFFNNIFITFSFLGRLPKEIKSVLGWGGPADKTRCEIYHIIHSCRDFVNIIF